MISGSLLRLAALVGCTRSCCAPHEYSEVFKMVSVRAVLFFGLPLLSQQADRNPILSVDAGDECTVVISKNFNTSSSIDILSYITPNNPMNINLSFKERNKFLYLDTLVIHNHQITHDKHRRDGHSYSKYASPVVIPEGWNKQKLMVTDKNLTLEWINGKDKVSLLALTLDFPFAKVFLRGVFAACSGVSPEWDVNEGKEIILLQPLENEQLLEVTGNGSLLVDNETSCESQKRLFTNTTLVIQASRQDSHSTISIKEKNAGKQEVCKWEKPETPRPQMPVRSVNGMIHLRLLRSDASASDKDYSSNILEDSIYHVLAFVLGAIFSCIIIYLILPLMRRHDRQTIQSQEGQDQETVPLNDIRSSGGDNSSSPVIPYEQESSRYDARKTAREILGKVFPHSDSRSKSIKKRSTST